MLDYHVVRQRWTAGVTDQNVSIMLICAVAYARIPLDRWVVACVFGD